MKKSGKTLSSKRAYLFYASFLVVSLYAAIFTGCDEGNDSPPATNTSCTDNDGDGYSIEGGDCGDIDCDDSDNTVTPDATEVCGDGVDNDCSGGDKTCAPNCTDTDGDTYAVEGSACGPVDCNDNDISVNPDAIELCGDSIDNDCSGGDEICQVDTVISVGKVWMDRNLGASRIAKSSTDSAAYGDLYQWGREADGHQIRTSLTTSGATSTDDPGHGNFINVSIFAELDWRYPHNDSLWQGTSGTNNPCPAGFRLPTSKEWDTERASWGSDDAAGAFASPLKLVVAGLRSWSSGNLLGQGSFGFYWSSTVNGSYARNLYFPSDNNPYDSDGRAIGQSVRCIED